MIIGKKTASQADSTQWQFIKVFLLIYFVVFGLMVSSYIAKFGMSLSVEHDRWGQFGDFFGGILNPLTSFFTLIVAVFVWRLQQTELLETKQTLKEQAAHLSSANLREQQAANEKLIFSVMEKIEVIASTMGIGSSDRPRNEHINSLAAVLWNYALNKDEKSFNFADSYGRKDQVAIDLIVDDFLPQLSPYLDLITLTLQIIEKRIDDKQIFVQLFCAQIGQPQLSLVSLIACSSQLKELHRLVLQFKLHEKLPKTEYNQHLQYGWYS